MYATADPFVDDMFGHHIGTTLAVCTTVMSRASSLPCW